MQHFSITNGRKRNSALIGVAAVLLLGTIAGLLIVTIGNASGGHHQPRSLTKNAYIARSDAICRQTARAVADLKVPADTADGRSTADFLGSAISRLRTQAGQLVSLPAPTPDRALLASLLREQQAIINQLDAAAAGYSAGRSAQGLAKLKPIAAGEQHLQAEFRSYGFKICGRLSRG